MSLDQNLPESELIGVEHKPIAWVPVSEIAKGDVGVVFKVADSNGKNHYAMKVEQLAKGAQPKNIEKSVLAALHDDPNSLQLIDYNFAGQFRCTIMTLAGPDLSVVKKMLAKKFSDSTILRLAIRTLMAIKSLHEHCYLHRDIEPANLALPLDPTSRNVYLLDFGSSRQYARRENGKWLLRAARGKVPFRGSVQYCSPKTHELEEAGRVDDLWSWLYVFVELRAFLPWTDSTHESNFAPRKRKLLDEILQSEPFLKKFIPVANLLKTYKFEDRPDYSKIFEILSAAMKEMGAKWSDPMDYDLLLDRRSITAKTEDDRESSEKVAAAFSSVVVPGGKQYLMAPKTDFFAKTKQKEGKEKKSDGEKEKKSSTEGVEKDGPSKYTEAASKQKVSRFCKKSTTAGAKNKNKTRSTTSSASRHTPPSPGETATVSFQPKRPLTPSVGARNGLVTNKAVQS